MLVRLATQKGNKEREIRRLGYEIWRNVVGPVGLEPTTKGL